MERLRESRENWINDAIPVLFSHCEFRRQFVLDIRKTFWNLAQEIWNRHNGATASFSEGQLLSCLLYIWLAITVCGKDTIGMVGFYYRGSTVAK